MEERLEKTRSGPVAELVEHPLSRERCGRAWLSSRGFLSEDSQLIGHASFSFRQDLLYTSKWRNFRCVTGAQDLLGTNGD